MSSITEPRGKSGSAPFFSKQATVAGPGFSRWMVPPAALAVHLCIGQAYAFSVFNAPLTRVIGITESAPDDWSLTTAIPIAPAHHRTVESFGDAQKKGPI